VILMGLLLAVLLALPAIASASTYSNQVLSGSPAGYWRLDELSGTTAADSAGTNTGTYMGGFTLGAPGAISGDSDTAVLLDGLSGTVMIPDSSSLDPSTAITLEAWIKPSSLPSAGSTMILRKDSQYQLSIAANGSLGFRVYQGGVAEEVDSAAGTAPVGNWTYVVGTWDGSKMTLYVDGTAVASMPLSGSIDTTTSRLWLGSIYNSWGYFAGDLDEVAVYPSALSASEVQDHWGVGTTGQPPPPPPPPQTTSPYPAAVEADSPLGYWPLSETSGNIAADETGSDSGSYLGGVTLGQQPPLATSADTSAGLDGVSGTVQIPAAASISPSSALSIEAWIRPTAYPSSSNSILRKDGQYALRLTQGGAVIFRLWQGGTTYDLTSPVGVAPVDSWTYVAGTWDGTTMTLYVDGNPVASEALSGAIDAPDSGLYLGSTYDSYDYFQGDLAQVALYGSALPASRVLAHYLDAGPNVSLDSPAAGSTMDATPTFGGSAGTQSADSADVSVKIYTGSSPSGSPVQTLTAPVDTNGIFSINSGALASGTYTAVASQTDDTGNVASRSTTFTVAAGGDPTLLAAGDIGDCTSPGSAATEQLLEELPGTVAAIGDLAYPDGSPTAINQCYDPTWGRQYARTRPALGDHDYGTGTAAAYFQYWGSNAGTSGEGWYSYNLGSWHIVVLNTECGEISGGCGAGSPEEQWLRADLAAHPAACTLAYFHEPLFSSAATSAPADPEVEPFWQDLYNAGADVVVSAQYHSYERFAAQDPSGAADPSYGIREFVVGTGGRYADDPVVQVQPNSQVINDQTKGVLELTLHASSYSWQFIPVAGQTFTDSGSGTCHGAPGASNPTPPTSSATAPALTNSAKMTVSYTASDPSGPGLAEVDLYAEAPGQTSYAKVASNTSGGGAGSFSYTAAAGDGTYSFYTIATDTAGNVQSTPSSPQATTLLDTTPPTSTATAPATSTATSWNVAYTASDSQGGSGLAEVDLYAEAPGQTSYAKVASNTSGGGSGSFSYTATAGDGTYSFYTIATDKAGNVQSTPSSPQASTTLSSPQASTTTTAVAPAAGTAGGAIGSAAVSATLSGASASAGGTITFKVYGPQPTAPPSCASGGTTVGTATVSGSGLYHPSAGYTPSAAGDYWWYASYGGDGNDGASASGCGAGMAETVVHSEKSVASATATTHNYATTSSFSIQPNASYLLLVIRHSQAGDAVSSIASSGLSPALGTASFTSIATQSYASSGYQWAYELTTGSGASGTGRLTITFAKTLGSNQITIVDLVMLAGDNVSAPVVTSTVGKASGTAATATASLTSPPGAPDAGVVVLSSLQALGSTLPAASPPMASVFYSYQTHGSLAVYAAAPAAQSVSFAVGSGKNWGTLALEVSHS
jgi:hypothetical protein